MYPGWNAAMVSSAPTADAAATRTGTAPGASGRDGAGSAEVRELINLAAVCDSPRSRVASRMNETRIPSTDDPAQRLLLAAQAGLESTGLMELKITRAAYRRAYFAYKRHMEDPFAQLVRGHPGLFASGDVFDVGANIGYTATVFASAVDPGRRVFAFEPEGRNFGMLREVVTSMRLEGRLIPVRAAVGATEGTTALWVNRGHPADHRVVTEHLADHLPEAARSEQVPLVTLDDFSQREAIDSVSFVKIDVQGYELPVCEGMSGILDRNPSACVALEYAPRQMAEQGFEPEALRRFFAARGYRIYLLARNRPLTPWSFDRPVPGNRGYCDLIASLEPLD
jgi:FkbM family methyltransferase